MPWWLAVLLYPFIAFAWAIYALVYLVGLLLVGVAWLVTWPFRRKRSPQRRPRPRASTGTPGDGQVRLEIHIRDDSA